jgi:hypothetical protein
MIEGNFKEDSQRLMRTTQSIETVPTRVEHDAIKR